MNEFANKHIGAVLNIEKLNKVLDDLGINEDTEDKSEIIANAIKSPEVGKKGKPNV